MSSTNEKITVLTNDQARTRLAELKEDAARELATFFDLMSDLSLVGQKTTQDYVTIINGRMARIANEAREARLGVLRSEIYYFDVVVDTDKLRAFRENAALCGIKKLKEGVVARSLYGTSEMTLEMESISTQQLKYTFCLTGCRSLKDVQQWRDSLGTVGNPSDVYMKIEPPVADTE